MSIVAGLSDEQLRQLVDHLFSDGSSRQVQDERLKRNMSGFGLPALIEDYTDGMAADYGKALLPGTFRRYEPLDASQFKPKCRYCGTRPGPEKSCVNCGAPT